MILINSVNNNVLFSTLLLLNQLNKHHQKSTRFTIQNNVILDYCVQMYLVPYLISLQLTKIARQALTIFMLHPSSWGPMKLVSSPQVKDLKMYGIRICQHCLYCQLPQHCFALCCRWHMYTYIYMTLRGLVSYILMQFHTLHLKKSFCK